MNAWSDIALVYDPETRRCDIAVADGDLALDDTPVTAVLVSLGSDRRARPDDALPAGVTDFNASGSMVERRGWAGDALDETSGRIGSRLWLLDREKQTEIVRRRAEGYVAEALAWVPGETGVTPAIDVTWLRPGWLGIAVTVGRTEIPLRRKVA